MNRINIILIIFFLLAFDANAAKKNSKSWIAAGIQLTTLDPNIKYAYLWCVNTVTKKRFRCVGPQASGLPRRTDNPTKMSVNLALRKLQYGLGDLRKLRSGTYQIDALEISLGHPSDKVPRKLLEHDLLPFGIQFKIDGEFNYLGNFQILFERDNLYRLIPSKIDISNDTQFALDYMGEKIRKKFIKRNESFELQNVNVSIDVFEPDHFTKLNEWGVLPKLKYKKKCFVGYKKAEIKDGSLIIERSPGLYGKPRKIDFPSESKAPWVGCLISNHLSLTGFTEYKLSSLLKKPEVDKLIIPIEFR